MENDVMGFNVDALVPKEMARKAEATGVAKAGLGPLRHRQDFGHHLPHWRSVVGGSGLLVYLPAANMDGSQDRPISCRSDRSVMTFFMMIWAHHHYNFHA